MSKNENASSAFSEATVVQPREARTVVRPAEEFAPSFPADMPEVPRTPAATLTPPTPVATATEKPKRSRRAPKPLDMRTKLMMAGITACAVAAMVFVVGGNTSGDLEAQNPQAEETALASEQSPSAPTVRELPGPPVSTTSEVLSRFDRASARAQERAERYSQSGSGI